MNSRKITHSPSYENGRRCLYCSKPIADQEHAARVFCEKYYDEMGKVHDCKTIYHRKHEKPDKLIQNSIGNSHRVISNKISSMICNRGLTVSTEDLNAYGIELTKAISFEIMSDGTLTTIFLGYRIVSNPKTNQHLISIYEQ